MQPLEAKIILRCQRKRYIKQIWSSLVAFESKRYSYPQIAQKCEELYLLGYLVRQKIGKMVFYTATEQGMQKAIEAMNELGEEKQREMQRVKIIMNNRRITEFV